MKVILCGPPQSGKSCLRDGLKQAIGEIEGRSGKPYPYFFTPNPDGEGAWYQETCSADPDAAARLKQAYRQGYSGTFTDDLAAVFADWMRKCSVPLALADTGGKISPQNEKICRAATEGGRKAHAILLYADDREADRDAWRAFCNEVGLEMLAEVRSFRGEGEDVVPTRGEDGVWRGTVHNLERGQRAGGRATVRKLAEILVDAVEAENGGEPPKEREMTEMTGKTYHIAREGENLLRIGFGDPAHNDHIVRDAAEQLDRMIGDGTLGGGGLLKINGPASLPAAFVIAHKVAHLFGAVAVFDPKMNRYVVSISHDPAYALGDLVE